MRESLICWILLMVFGGAGVVSAQEGKAASEEVKEGEVKFGEEKGVEGKKVFEEKVVETKHEKMIGGELVKYTVRAGKMPVKMEGGKVTGEIFYMAYTRDGVEGGAKRPVTFSFNGGPGASSVWMHLGLLGPRRVKLRDDGRAYPPPYELEDNEHSLLDVTDLVFIDPVGTGYSRADKVENAKKFYGVKEDVASVGEFIRLYVTKTERWGSPKFLIGESYGTTRAAALSGELFAKHHMNLNGIMLVSTVLNFQTIADRAGNDLAHVMFLPSYAAVAWHHKKLAAEYQKLSLGEVAEEAEKFAAGEYQAALFAGASLPVEERVRVIGKMAKLTGLGEEFLDRVDLRPSMARFSVELLRGEGKQTGRFDGRYSGYVRDRQTESFERDESADAVFPVFAAAFNQYVRQELKVEEDEPYEVLARVGPWNWDAENEYLNVGDALARAMMGNPYLKVHVSAGYADLATPYFAAEYTMNHLPIAKELRKNLVIDHYEAGHMMFLNKADLQKQKADLAKFIRGALGR